MSRPSLARSLLLALVGLTIALAVVAALSVSAFFQTRQEYEDRLATSYAVEVATANLIAAGVVEETILLGRSDRAARRQAERSFAEAAGAARDAAGGDRDSRRLVEIIATTEESVRTAATRARRADRRSE